MGYTTEFEGEISIEPPLNEHEIAYLKGFNYTRRMHRNLGPYFTDTDDTVSHGNTGAFGLGHHGQNHREDVVDYNKPGPEQPGLWCGWTPNETGTAIVWDGGEKFYDSRTWMTYLIDTFLKPGATLQQELMIMNQVPGRFYPAEFGEFTFDHVLNGVIEAQGEDEDDRWSLVVENGVVTVE